jgi:hypothetical protein
MKHLVIHIIRELATCKSTDLLRRSDDCSAARLRTRRRPCSLSQQHPRVRPHQRACCKGGNGTWALYAFASAKDQKPSCCGALPAEVSGFSRGVNRFTDQITSILGPGPVGTFNFCLHQAGVQHQKPPATTAGLIENSH